MNNTKQASVPAIFKLSVGLILLIAGFSSQPMQAEAGAGTLSLSPAAGAYVVGSTFSVAVKEDSGATAINAVQADLTYNPSQLQLVGIDTSSSALDIKAVETGGNGKLSMVRAKLHTPLTGSQLVGSVTFKVLGSSGVAEIQFAPSSSIQNASTHKTIWNGNRHGGRYTLKANGTVTHSTTSTSGNSKNLVAIKVTAGSNSVKDAKVVLDGTLTSVTDSTGVASFHNVSSGVHSVSVSGKGQTKTDSVTVNPQPGGKVQEFSVVLAAAKKPGEALWYIALLALILTFAVIWGSKRKPVHSPRSSHHNNHEES